MDQSMVAFALRGLGLPDYVLDMAKRVAELGDGRDPLDLLHDDAFIAQLRQAFPNREMIKMNDTDSSFKITTGA